MPEFGWGGLTASLGSLNGKPSSPPEDEFHPGRETTHSG